MLRPTTAKKTTAAIKKLEISLKKWETGKLSLTGVEVNSLKKQIRELIHHRRAICPHKNTVIKKGIVIDSGYGLDVRHDTYDIYCHDCFSTLLCRSDRTLSEISEKSTLEETVKKYLKYNPHHSEALEQLMSKENGRKV